MKANNFMLIVLACMWLLMADATLAEQQAPTLSQLQQSGKLRIKTWIEPRENIVARQQVNLQIEVSTDKWFRGGTRIRHFEVEDAIILQRENFAVNSTLVEGETTWTVQLWTLVVYPQTGGVVNIPAIPLELSIAGDDNQAIVGNLSTRPFSFVVKIPAEIGDKTGWVATNSFDVQESYNKSADGLKPGDALIRTIKISADNLPAMMLPKTEAAEIEGIAVYKKPPQIVDKVNRGDYLAQRTDEITYVFEQPGDYQLPAQTFYWWDLQSQSLESIEIEALLLSVGGSATGIGQNLESEQISEKIGSTEPAPLLMKLVVALIVLLIALITTRRLEQRRVHSAPLKQTHLSEAVLLNDFKKACSRKELERAMGLFYKWLDSYGGDTFNGTVREQLNKIDRAELSQEFNRLMVSIYHTGDFNNADLRSFAKQYIKAIKKSEHATRFSSLSVELKLN